MTEVSKPMFAHGTKLQMSDMEETPEFSDIALLESISGPSMSADEIDITTHDSEDGFREFIQGLKDPGEVTVEGYFMPTEDSHTDLIDVYESGDVTDFKIIFPDASDTEFTFKAFVTEVEIESPLDDKTTFSASFKLTGKPSLGS